MGKSFLIRKTGGQTLVLYQIEEGSGGGLKKRPLCLGQRAGEGSVVGDETQMRPGTGVVHVDFCFCSEWKIIELFKVVEEVGEYQSPDQISF